MSVDSMRTPPAVRGEQQRTQAHQRHIVWMHNLLGRQVEEMRQVSLLRDGQSTLSQESSFDGVRVVGDAKTASAAATLASQRAKSGT